MRELRRIRTGPFHEDRGLVTMQELAEALYRWRVEGKEDLLRRYILPGEYTVCGMPKVVLRDTAVESVVNGAILAVPGISMIQEGINRGDLVALHTLKGELIGLGRALMSTREVLESERGEAVKPERIIMEPGLYPRAWRRRS